MNNYNFKTDLNTVSVQNTSQYKQNRHLYHQLMLSNVLDHFIFLHSVLDARQKLNKTALPQPEVLHQSLYSPFLNAVKFERRWAFKNNFLQYVTRFNSLNIISTGQDKC